MNELPEWAVKAAEEAGVSLEGWVFDSETRAIEYSKHPDYLSVVPAVGQLGKLFVRQLGKLFVMIEGEAYPAPEAFRLAHRLRLALEGKPDPRVAELEAENERLRKVVEQACDEFAIVEVAEDVYKSGNYDFKHSHIGQTWVCFSAFRIAKVEDAPDLAAYLRQREGN